MNVENLDRRVRVREERKRQSGGNEGFGQLMIRLRAGGCGVMTAMGKVHRIPGHGYLRLNIV
jgi:hypothetical protein